MIQEWAEEVELEKRKYENLCKELESKRKQQIKEVNHCYSAVIDGKSLQIYLNEHSREIDSMRFAASMALEHSADPSMLVLDALQGFYKEIDSEAVRRSCSVLLEELMKFPPETRPWVKKEARRIANNWVGRLKSEHEIVCFLQLLACYGLASGFKAGKLLTWLEIVANHSLAPALVRALGLKDKVSYFVGNLIEKKKKLIEAFKLIYGFGLAGRFQPVSLLNTFLRTSMISVENLRKENVTLEGQEIGKRPLEEQIGEIDKEIKAHEDVIKCIEDYRITGLSPEKLMKRIAQLEKEKPELKRRPVSIGKPRPKHWNKHPRTRNSSDYHQTRKSRDVLYSPPRHYVRPAYNPPFETKLDGNGATVTPAYHWGALGNFGPGERFG